MFISTKKTYKKTIIDGMRVAKIKNRYLYKKNTGVDMDRYHHYLVYTDRYSGENVAIATTHLYLPDGNRFRQLKNGDGIAVQLPGFDTPSLVRKKTYVFNSNDREIDFAHRDVHIKGKLSKSKARKIFSFINKSRKNKK